MDPKKAETTAVLLALKTVAEKERSWAACWVGLSAALTAMMKAVSKAAW